jgi:hypothetical protein
MRLEEIPIRVVWTHPMFGPQCTEVVDSDGSLTTGLASAFPGYPSISVDEASEVIVRSFAIMLSRAMRVAG